MNILLILCLLLPFFSAQSEADMYLSQLTPFGFTGTVLIAEDGEITLRKGYGLADKTTGAPNTPDTIFGIGSITKLFTAFAVLQLHERGLLNVDDTLSHYFENLPAEKQNITIRQVIYMEAGLADYHDTEGDFQPMTRDEAETIILNTPLIDEPGNAYHYSNSGYTLLAILIEKVSGQPYPEFVRDNILTPLGMNRTGFWGESFENMAFTENAYNGYNSPAGWGHSWVVVGNGGMVSTPGDLYFFLQEMLTPTLISEALLKEFYPLERGFFAAGGGGGSDFVAVMGYDPVENITLIGATSERTFNIEALTPILLDIAKGETVNFPPETIELAAETLEKYVGTYALNDDETLEITLEDGNLYVNATGQAGVNLLLGEGAFESPIDQTSQVLASASEGDFAPFAAALETPPQEVEAMWADFESQNGTFQSFEILGAAPGEISEIATLTRLNFENGTLYLYLSWSEDVIGEILIMPAARPLLKQRFLPQSETEFVTFSLHTDQNPVITFETDELGNVIGLVIGEVNATKI